MPQYIKKEMPDLNGTGEKKAYYKLKTWRKLEFKEFIKRCSSIHRAYGKSVIEGVMTAVCEHLAYEISNGYSVKIDGLGTFTAKLGVREDKEMDGFEEGTTKRNAKSIEVTGVGFRADKDLVKEIDQNCDLVRGGEERLKKPKFPKEERIEKARKFLKQNGYMRVDEYAQLTGLSYSTASRELRSIVSDPSSGITSQGRKSGKLYLLAKEGQD
jgi:predicted histone-like DNA-binding protein